MAAVFHSLWSVRPRRACVATAMANAADNHELERERQRRRQAEAQVELLKAQLEYYKAALKQRQSEVRYRLGDALVRAARPSLDTLKLPVRLASLVLEGIRRQRERRATEAGRRKPAAPDAHPPAPHFDAVPLVREPFATVPPELRRRRDLCIAAVTDEFSWWAWQFEADVYTFMPNTWQAALEERRPDVLLIESTWRGLADSWHYQLRDLGRQPNMVTRYAILDIVAWCQERGIPTVFYNKEDPPNFEFFIDTAKLFDYVFTSDANCIPAYRAQVRHERVGALPFAAQPRLNNPVLTQPRDGSVCFAGTWYQHRHSHRQDAAAVILRPALDFDLHIYDRMANTVDPNYQWPRAFRPALRGNLPYAQMLNAYKRYKVFLNVNSVTNSPTMFARRVFELLACGTPVISSYSDGIRGLLGEDVVLMSTDAATTRQHLERLLGDDEYRDRLALRGQRRVFAAHTYTHRLQTILDALGLARPPRACPCVTMLAAADSAAQVRAAWENFRRQTYAHKRLVLCATQPAAAASVDQITQRADAVHVVATDGPPWGRSLGEALRACAPGFIAALNPRDCYGPEYLTDYVHATLYVTEAALGKAAFYESDGSGAPRSVGAGGEYRVGAAVHPWTLCLDRDRLLAAAGALMDAGTPADWWAAVARQLPSVYAADRFNYVRNTAPTGEVPAAAVQIATV